MSKKSTILIPVSEYLGVVTIQDLNRDNQGMGEVYFKTTDDDEQIQRYKKSLVGKIKILNYEN